MQGGDTVFHTDQVQHACVNDLMKRPAICVGDDLACELVAAVRIRPVRSRLKPGPETAFREDGRIPRQARRMVQQMLKMDVLSTADLQTFQGVQQIGVRRQAPFVNQ